MQFIKSYTSRLEIQMGSQSEMIKTPFYLQAFQLESSIKNSKDMIDLGNHPLQRGFTQSGILPERFVENFHRPSFLIGRLNELSRHRCITASPIENSRAAIFIVKDSAPEQYRKRHIFEQPA